MLGDDRRVPRPVRRRAATSASTPSPGCGPSCGRPACAPARPTTRHALHTPYWWLRCAVGKLRDDDHPLVRLYHRLLVWDIAKAPLATRLPDRLLNPVLGKSLVVYARKPGEPAMWLPDVPGIVTARSLRGDRRLDRRVAAAVRDDPVVPRRARRPVEPRRGGDGAVARRSAGRRRAGLRVARPHAAARRLVAPVLPGRLASSRTSSTPTCAPTSPPACGSTTCCTTTPASSRPCGRSSSGPSTSCSTCRPRGVRSSGPATPTARRGRSRCSPGRRRSATRCAARSRWPTISGHERPDWELSAAALAHVIVHEPEAFQPKHRWAMDWYYPVLTGVIGGDAGRERLGGPVRRVRDGRPRACGASTTARGSPPPRRASAPSPTSPSASADIGPRAVLVGAGSCGPTTGRYWTGIVFPEEVHFPGGEQSTYTAASVVLAADAIAGSSPPARCSPTRPGCCRR